VSLADGVALVRLDFPQRRNCMDLAMTAAWTRLLADLTREPTLRAVVLTGAGTAFSSGGDTSWIGADAELGIQALRERMLAYYRSWLAVRDLPVPVIAALNGPAVGAGAALALACDIRWASGSASMSFPFTRLAIHPGMGSTWLLREVAGNAVARDLLLTGRPVRGAELLQLGLVTRVLDVEDFGATVASFATEIALTAPIAERSTLSSLRAAKIGSLHEALEAEAQAQAITMTSTDLVEGLAAARERRAPRFEGR
jgi:enoyl-CoA hydratase